MTRLVDGGVCSTTKAVKAVRSEDSVRYEKAVRPCGQTETPRGTWHEPNKTVRSAREVPLSRCASCNSGSYGLIYLRLKMLVLLCGLYIRM